ncbi:MAG TPA: metallophosphatase family protein [Oxalobacteraceae bacterium]|nr:metallophosphatase family protein [Oxalobacteraceae bacterium]
MRIAHFSDLHYCAKYLTEADRCFSYAVDRAIALQAEVAVISGDATDHALDVHAPAVAAFARQLRRLADHCPVLMLQGTYSHEPPGTLAVFGLLGGRFPIYVADRIGQVALTTAGRWLASNGWCFEQVPGSIRALFSCVPTVNKAAVAATMGAGVAAEAVGQQLSLLLRGFVPSHHAARAMQVPSIGVSHGTVYGCVTEHGVPMAGFDHEFTTGSLFGARAQAFLLGHIHRHQQWEADGQRIAYAGSIGRFHYGEEGEKGFLLWEVDARTGRCVLQPTPARRTIDLSFEGKPELAAIRAAAADGALDGAFVRVRWQVPDEDRHEVDRGAIQRILRDAAEVRLEGRILPVIRTRAAGIAQAVSMADKVRAWAVATECMPEPLLACLENLHCHAPEAIAAAILGRTAEPAKPDLEDSPTVVLPAERLAGSTDEPEQGVSS